MPAGPWPPTAVSWAFGTTIHVGDQTIEVGHDVRAFVRTASGFVILDDADAVYSVTGFGVTEIGQMPDTRPNNIDQQRLVVNSHGRWWAGSTRLRPATLSWGSTTRRPGSLGPPGAGCRPPDDVCSSPSTTAPATGVPRRASPQSTSTPVASARSWAYRRLVDDFEIYSVENGVMAFSPNDDGTFFAGRSLSRTHASCSTSAYSRATNGHTDPVRLSPTGAWLSFGVARLRGSFRRQHHDRRDRARGVRPRHR